MSKKDQKVMPIKHQLGYVYIGILVFLTLFGIAESIGSENPSIGDHIAWYALPILSAVIMLALWLSVGRDPKGRDVIVTQFEPPLVQGKFLPPALMALLYYDSFGIRAITAEVIYLANEGYLYIENLGRKKINNISVGYENYKFKRSGKKIGSLVEYDIAVLEWLFSDGLTVESNDLVDRGRDDLNFVLKKIRTLVYKHGSDLGLIVLHTYRLRTIIAIGGVVLIALGIMLAEVSESISAFTLSFITSGLIFFVASFVIPRMTKNGILIREYIEGFIKYLEKAEKQRLEFHNNPKSMPDNFDFLLPYAISLGVSSSWDHVFDEILDRTERRNRPISRTFFEGSDSDSDRTIIR